MILLMPGLSSADVLVYKSGKTIEGIITRVSEGGVTIKSGKDILWVSYTLIRNIYKSTGPHAENSRNIYRARQAIGAFAKTNLTTSSPAISETNDLNISAVTREPKIIKQKNVDVYITSWCPYCKKMLAFLNQNKIQYRSYDIEKDSSAYSVYKNLGGTGVPVLNIDGQVVRGCDTDEVMSILRQ